MESQLLPRKLTLRSEPGARGGYRGGEAGEWEAKKEGRGSVLPGNQGHGYPSIYKPTKQSAFQLP